MERNLKVPVPVPVPCMQTRSKPSPACHKRDGFSLSAVTGFASSCAASIVRSIAAHVSLLRSSTPNILLFLLPGNVLRETPCVSQFFNHSVASIFSHFVLILIGGRAVKFVPEVFSASPCLLFPPVQSSNNGKTIERSKGILHPFPRDGAAMFVSRKHASPYQNRYKSC